MFLTPQRKTLLFLSQFSSHSSRTLKYKPRKMGKNNRKGPSEGCLILPNHPGHTTAAIVDTHTHLVSTYAAYRQKYKDGKYESIYDFVKGLYVEKKVATLVDVWCEAPVRKVWKEIADSAITPEDRKDKWGGIEYWFVMGAFQSKNAGELIVTRFFTGVHP